MYAAAASRGVIHVALYCIVGIAGDPNGGNEWPRLYSTSAATHLPKVLLYISAGKNLPFKFGASALGGKLCKVSEGT